MNRQRTKATPIARPLRRPVDGAAAFSLDSAHWSSSEGSSKTTGLARMAPSPGICCRPHEWPLSGIAQNFARLPPCARPSLGASVKGGGTAVVGGETCVSCRTLQPGRMALRVTVCRSRRAYPRRASSNGKRDNSSIPVCVIKTCCSSFTPSPPQASPMKLSTQIVMPGRISPS